MNSKSKEGELTEEQLIKRNITKLRDQIDAEKKRYNDLRAEPVIVVPPDFKGHGREAPSSHCADRLKMIFNGIEGGLRELSSYYGELKKVGVNEVEIDDKLEEIREEFRLFTGREM